MLTQALFSQVAVSVPRPFRSADGPVRRLGDITELPPFAGERSVSVARAAPAQLRRFMSQPADPISTTLKQYDGFIILVMLGYFDHNDTLDNY